MRDASDCQIPFSLLSLKMSEYALYDYIRGRLNKGEWYVFQAVFRGAKEYLFRAGYFDMERLNLVEKDSEPDLAMKNMLACISDGGRVSVEEFVKFFDIVNAMHGETREYCTFRDFVREKLISSEGEDEDEDYEEEEYDDEEEEENDDDDDDEEVDYEPTPAGIFIEKVMNGTRNLFNRSKEQKPVSTNDSFEETSDNFVLIKSDTEERKMEDVKLD